MSWPMVEAVLVKEPAPEVIAVLDVRLAVRLMALHSALVANGRPPRERLEYRLLDRDP